MDRNILLQHLAQTERHIAEGEEHLAQQALLIEKLERHGRGSEDARALLKTMTETQALHKQARDRVLKGRTVSTSRRYEHEAVAGQRSCGGALSPAGRSKREHHSPTDASRWRGKSGFDLGRL